MMNIQIDFTWKTALQAANILVFKNTGKYLSDIEIIILRGAWNNHTYEQIAEAEGYTSGYLCRDVGCKLWGTLSTALKEKVSKKNFKAALQREWKNCTQDIQEILLENQTQLTKPVVKDKILYNGLVTSDSSFYLERSPIESICYETILKPGSLIRIEGAKWIGKTSLMERILEQGNLKGQKTVYLDFDNVKRETLQDSDKLLRWMCLMVSCQLQSNTKVKDYWYTGAIDNNNCTLYFKKYILSQIKNDLVLALDNIDRLFFYKKTSRDFLRLLGNWHEQARTDRYWSKLKLILSHSTKARIPLNITRSPFNAGVPILLEEFNCIQVKALANLYHLNLDELELERLIDEVGGHPYFLRLAMYQMKNKKYLKALQTSGVFNTLRRI